MIRDRLVKASRKKWFYTEDLEIAVFFFIDSNKEEDISRTISNINIFSNGDNDIYVVDIAPLDVDIFKTFEGVRYLKVKEGFEPEKISSLMSDKNIVVGVSSNISLSENFLDYIDTNLSNTMSFFEARNIGNSVLFMAARDVIYMKEYALYKPLIKDRQKCIPNSMFSISNFNFKDESSLDFKVVDKFGKEVDLYNNKVIKGMWIGDSLSNVEKLSINSFLKNGHDFHLYVYEDIKGIPDGVVVKDANTVLGRDKIFKYRKMGKKEGNDIGNEGFAGFSDWFRYALLHKEGGWWSDLDSICLKKFEILRPYFFTTLRGKGHYFTNGIFKTPKNSLVMSFCIDKCENVGSNSKWAQTGPRLLGQGHRNYGLNCFAKTEEVFDLFKGGNYLFKDVDVDLKEAYSVHMYNSEISQRGKDKNGIFPKNSLFEKLKRKYL